MSKESGSGDPPIPQKDAITTLEYRKAVTQLRGISMINPLTITTSDVLRSKVLEFDVPTTLDTVVASAGSYKRDSTHPQYQKEIFPPPRYLIDQPIADGRLVVRAEEGNKFACIEIYDSFEAEDPKFRISIAQQTGNIRAVQFMPGEDTAVDLDPFGEEEGSFLAEAYGAFGIDTDPNPDPTVPITVFHLLQKACRDIVSVVPDPHFTEDLQ